MIMRVSNGVQTVQFRHQITAVTDKSKFDCDFFPLQLAFHRLQRPSTEVTASHFNSVVTIFSWSPKEHTFGSRSANKEDKVRS